VTRRLSRGEPVSTYSQARPWLWVVTANRCPAAAALAASTVGNSWMCHHSRGGGRSICRLAARKQPGLPRFSAAGAVQPPGTGLACAQFTAAARASGSNIVFPPVGGS
jgi:hypothetical protein